MTQETKKVLAIYGNEPPRADEFPTAHVVGSESWVQPGARLKVTSIVYREQNLGTYGIGWYDVFSDDVLMTSMNATAVAEVHYDRG